MTGDTLPVPPDELIWRVAGHRNPDSFVRKGLTSREDIERALSAVGRDLGSARRILDFGCGCGRIMRWMGDLDGPELVGIDIDADAIEWAAANIPFARFEVGPWRPPTQFDDATFDLVINHSVFTHLDEDYQDAWLGELQRITEPGAVLVLSVNAEKPFSRYEDTLRNASVDPAKARAVIEQKGLIYIDDDGWKGSAFPDFYHSTFHAPWYVFEHWQQWFELLAYIPRGNLGSQDTVVMRNRGSEPAVPLIGRRLET